MNKNQSLKVEHLSAKIRLLEHLAYLFFIKLYFDELHGKGKCGEETCANLQSKGVCVKLAIRTGSAWDIRLKPSYREGRPISALGHNRTREVAVRVFVLLLCSS